MFQISAYHLTTEYGPKEELLILQYNLDGKVQKQYQDMCKDGANTLCWYFPTEYKYYLDPPNKVIGKKIKSWFRVYLY